MRTTSRTTTTTSRNPGHEKYATGTFGAAYGEANTPAEERARALRWFEDEGYHDATEGRRPRKLPRGILPDLRAAYEAGYASGSKPRRNPEEKPKRKPTAAERTREMFPQCCPHCGATDHPAAACNVRPETRGTRQLGLFRGNPSTPDRAHPDQRGVERGFYLTVHGAIRPIPRGYYLSASGLRRRPARMLAAEKKERRNPTRYADAFYIVDVRGPEQRPDPDAPAVVAGPFSVAEADDMLNAWIADGRATFDKNTFRTSHQVIGGRHLSELAFKRPSTWPKQKNPTGKERREAWRRYQGERLDSIERERACRIDAEGKEHTAKTRALAEKAKRARILRPALATSREREAAARARAREARAERAACRAGERLQRQQARARARAAAGKPRGGGKAAARRQERAAAIQAARYHYEVSAPALVALFDDWIKRGAYNSKTGERTTGANERHYRDAFDEWAHDQGEKELHRLQQVEADEWLAEHPDPWMRETG